jgi:hypothetical protein
MGIQCISSIQRRQLVREHRGSNDGDDVHSAIILPNRTTLTATRESGFSTNRLCARLAHSRATPFALRIQCWAYRGRGGRVYA